VPSIRTLAFASLTVAAACGGDSLSVPAECNPLGGGVSCMMPWPSAAYLVDDATTETGLRVDLPVAAMPVNTSQIAVDPTPFNRWDGFSPSGPIVAAFPGGVGAAGLPGHRDPGASLEAGSPIVLVNMDTGDRAAFFAEVDMNSDDPAQRALIIRPVVRLAAGSRYAVGVTTAVKAPDGADLPIPAAFAAVRDGKGFDHPRMARLAPRYDAIFAALEAQGVARDDLALAWDFVTATDDNLLSDLLAMRTDALAAIGPVGANLGASLTSFDGDVSRVYKLVSGTITSPDFLTDGERDLSILRRDATGRPHHEGMRNANFTAIIPACVATAELPIPVMVFGHGLFGSGRGYLNDRFLQEVAQDYCFVVVGGDWIGLSERQIGVAALAANDLNFAGGITEKLAQAVIDFIAIEHAVRGPLRTDAMFAYESQPIMDPERVYYFGASLGGIMGTTFMALDPTVLRGVLGVPGGPWSMLFERSYAWNVLKGPAQASYREPANFQVLISLLAMRFEPYDPITAAPHVILDPLPDTPAKQILLYETIGDSLVANIASETLGRTMGLPVVMPSLAQPYGMAAADEVASSGFAIYDERPTPLPPEINQPPEDDNGTHADVHERPAVLRQIELFLYDGIVTNQCSDAAGAAPCDCGAGACQ
jgi:hypothetical protein